MGVWRRRKLGYRLKSWKVAKLLKRETDGLVFVFLTIKISLENGYSENGGYNIGGTVAKMFQLFGLFRPKGTQSASQSKKELYIIYGMRIPCFITIFA